MCRHVRVYAHFSLGPFSLHHISSEGCCNRNIRETNRALETFSENVKTNLALTSSFAICLKLIEDAIRFVSTTNE